MPTYDDLAGPSGGNSNAPGVASVGYYAPISTFATIEALAAAPASLTEECVIAADHVFATAGRFYKIHITETKGQLMGESVGDRESRGFNPKVTIVCPASDKAAIGFANVAKRDKYMFLIKQSGSGHYHQIGTEEHPAEVMPSHDSGTNDSGGNYLTFEVSSYQPNLIIYEGAISLTPAII